MNVFNVFCACAFTAEGSDHKQSGKSTIALYFLRWIACDSSAIRIVVLGFAQGPGTYMRSPWNVFDFVLIVTVWLSITAAALLGVSDDAGFALSVLRTLRLMRFFSGIRELMSAVALGYLLRGIHAVQILQFALVFGSISDIYIPRSRYKMLLTIMSLVLYAWVIGGVVGMELWAGAVSHHCLDPASQDALAAGLVVTDCPRMTRCELPMQCFAAVPPDIGALHEVQVRGNHLDKIGFDTIGMSFITEFQITIQDDWPELVQVSHISCVSRVFSCVLFSFSLVGRTATR